MNKKNLFIIIGLIIIAVVVVIILRNNQIKNQASPILFYGDTCPHCQIVEKYINDHDVQAHFKFKELEVFHDQANAQLLGHYAQRCQLNTEKGVGVPFLWTGKKCLIGQKVIINFFQNK